ncbi:hypothetical protein DCAR_0205809 [Daucus carota subsp. sativus]|uniref:Uncharacterized protein n=1 Tax=Daucus carota subsp. sativus TaxID=79200 RepID=A0A162AQ95_DAUCS|nr:hypothetical protein DCAR_0205809 [Daucus carota subsp. sativus]
MELGWELPPKGFVKVNVYGIFRETPLANGNRSGLGVLVRDSDGQILAMVSGALQIVNKRVNELWAMLMGLKCCLYVGKHQVILKTEHAEVLAEWEGWQKFVDPCYSDVIESLVQ